MVLRRSPCCRYRKSSLSRTGIGQAAGGGTQLKVLLVVLCLALPFPAVADSLYPGPPAHAELMARRPGLAFDGWAPWRIDLDLLREVNREVNASMAYRSEARDAWGSGADCDDYAVRKLETLMAAGVPRGALRLAVGRVSGRGHAVLVVRDLWVLDNRRDDLYRLDGGEQVVDAPIIEAWEATGGAWDPAGGFANLAEHLQWARER